MHIKDIGVININFLLNLGVIKRLSAEQKRVWPWVLWNLWTRRNDMIFEGRCLNAVELVHKAT